jgi:hypothetical protein
MNASFTTSGSLFLRRALLLDAAASGAMGVLLLLAASPLEVWLGLPTALLRGAGLVLLPFTAWVAWIAARDSLSRRMVGAVIVVNVLWALDSELLLFTGWVEPTTLGYAFVLAQAVVVAGLAEAQYVGLRRSSSRSGDLLSASKGV